MYKSEIIQNKCNLRSTWGPQILPEFMGSIIPTPWQSTPRSCGQGPKYSSQKTLHVLKTQRYLSGLQLGILGFTQDIPNNIGGLYSIFTAAHCPLCATPSMAAATHPSQRPLSSPPRPSEPIERNINSCLKKQVKTASFLIHDIM